MQRVLDQLFDSDLLIVPEVPAMTEEEKDAQALAEMEDDLGIGSIDLQNIEEDIISANKI